MDQKKKAHLEKHMPDILDEFSEILKNKYNVHDIELHGLTFKSGEMDGGHCTRHGCTGSSNGLVTGDGTGPKDDDK